MFEPALMLLVLQSLPEGGRRGDLRKVSEAGGPAWRQIDVAGEAHLSDADQLLHAPETSAICPSATVTYTPGGGRFGGALWPGAGAESRSPN